MSQRVRLIDHQTRCSCGHLLETHETWNRPCPCRRCECEGFYLVKEDGTVISTPPLEPQLTRTRATRTNEAREA